MKAINIGLRWPASPATAMLAAVSLTKLNAMPRLLYSLFFYLILPLVLLRLGYRALRAPDYRRRIACVMAARAIASARDEALDAAP